MPAPIHFPQTKRSSTPPLGMNSPAAGLCDEFHAGGYFLALTVDATGKENLAFIAYRPNGDVDPEAGPAMADISHLFATNANFRDFLSTYLQSVNAVYSVPPVATGPRAA